MQKTDKIYIAGHNGMVGSAILRQLQDQGFNNLLTINHAHLDLMDKSAVAAFLKKEQPDIVVLAAAKVGGIGANIESPAQFLYENLEIQNNVIHLSYLNGVRKLLFLGSSCIYPRVCPQPIKEECLLTGSLEPTNEGYALAKISGLKMLEFYKKQYGFNGISVMPCNLYGPNDSFDPQHSHVLSALVKKFVDAMDIQSQNVTIWGSGVARREFMHVDDLARAVVFLLQTYDNDDFINIGTGYDISIKELAEMIIKKVNYGGKVTWDTSKPDGMLKKCLDISKLNALGFEANISLEEGISQMIEYYKKYKSHKYNK